MAQLQTSPGTGKRAEAALDGKAEAGEADELRDGHSVAGEVHGGAAGLTEADRTWPFRGQPTELAGVVAGLLSPASRGEDGAGARLEAEGSLAGLGCSDEVCG